MEMNWRKISSWTELEFKISWVKSILVEGESSEKNYVTRKLNCKYPKLNVNEVSEIMELFNSNEMNEM